MSYQEELARLQGAKASMRQSIINKGVNVPESAKIEDYPGYIAQIGPSPIVPDVPDLTKVLTAKELSDIQAIVAAGMAPQKFELGQTLLITYGTYTMPFEIVGFEDIIAQVDGVENQVHALNLLTEYTYDGTTVWSPSRTYPYRESNIRSFISTRLNEISADFVACLANTKFQVYNIDGSIHTLYDKLYAPSITELGGTAAFLVDGQTTSEGPTFTAYQNATNEQRAKKAIGTTGAAQAYWTRTVNTKNNNGVGFITNTGAINNTVYYGSQHVVTACNLVG